MATTSVPYQSYPIICEGKTKIVRMSPDDNTLAVLVAKPDITAGDGAKHDIIQGKEQIATSTTCNIFKMLKSCGVSVAFREQLDEKTFSAEYCAMLPYEVDRKSTRLNSSH